jgi:selenide,water dikinase
MQQSGRVETDIVLLGAGHAHVEVLRRFALKPEPGVRLTVISPEPETPYSAMLLGLIRGDYSFDQAHIDLTPLAAMARARLILAEATAFDPQTRTVIIPGRPAVAFDILSIDIGGLSDRPDHQGIGVKPTGRFLAELEQLVMSLPAGARIAVIGGGPTDSELALALARRLAGHLRLTLVSTAPDAAPGAPASVHRVVRQALVEAGVELVFAVTASFLRNGRLGLSDGSSIDADAAIWATGVLGPPILAASGVSCDEAGCIRVSRTLRSVSHDFIFAAGDCASVEEAHRPNPDAGATRAGAALAGNLRRAVRGRQLRPWRRQKDPLAILGLGDGRAVAWCGPIAIQGHLIWRLKDQLDRTWMRKYTDMRMPADPDDAVRYGGLDTKAGILSAVPRDQGPDLMNGLDDASVIKPPSGKLLVQSVEHLQAFLDDPYVFGQIAAAHALSDIHAMGAEPWTAITTASVPYGPPGKMRSDLAAMLAGATSVLRGDGCSLVGRRCSEAEEVALGFSVTGLVSPEAILRKSGLRPGDRLILTKPLGTGIILAAHQRGKARSQWLLAATASMQMTNAVAVRVIWEFAPRAATDVTGLGLAGHLTEMLDASRSAAALWQEAIPALPGALALARRGIESPLAELNRQWVGRMPNAELLVDPQTSGGLLVGVPAARAAGCLAALRDAGVDAAEIGEVEPLREGYSPIRLT